MSYAVVHMKKIKTAGLKGVQFHHQRERESQTNPDIDKNKSGLNYDIVNSEKNIDFNKTVKNIIKENVITDRAIRKDAVVLCDFIISSDKNFFKNLTQEQQHDFFKKSCDFFKERYGAEKVVYAKVHHDEYTPHMHIGLVPITHENKLSAKSLFDRNELRALQDDYPKFIQEHGYELQRGEPKENIKHKETADFKKEQIKELHKELDNNLNALKGDLRAVEDTNMQLFRLKHINAKEALLGSKITLPKEDYYKILDLAKQSVLTKDELEKLRNENPRLKDENVKLKELSSNNFDRITSLRYEVLKNKEKYKKEHEKVSAMNKTLGEMNKEERDALLEKYREHLKEAEKIKAKSFEMER